MVLFVVAVCVAPGHLPVSVDRRPCIVRVHSYSVEEAVFSCVLFRRINTVRTRIRVKLGNSRINPEVLMSCCWPRPASVGLWSHVSIYVQEPKEPVCWRVRVLICLEVLLRRVAGVESG